MAISIGSIGKLLDKLNKTGEGIGFSLLGADQQSSPQVAGQTPATTGEVPGTAAPSEQPKQGLFESVGKVVGDVRGAGKQFGADLAEGIKEGIGGVFGQKTSDEDKQLKEEVVPEEKKKQTKNGFMLNAVDPIPLQALPQLQGGSSTRPSPDLFTGRQTGVNRLQEVLAQQKTFRDKIRRSRR